MAVDKPPKLNKVSCDMIIFVEASLKEIFRLKEKYPWPRPDNCPECKTFRVWKHGFVLAFFDGFSSGLLIRRFICPDCGTVIRMRPAGYFSRFQAPISTIRKSIERKFCNNKWLKHLSRSRQRHWYVALKRKIKAFIGDLHDGNPVAAFGFLVSKGVTPVSRSI